MPYNLTENQKDIVRWMVQDTRAGNLPEEFHVVWIVGAGGEIVERPGEHPELTKGALDALHTAGLIMSNIRYETKMYKTGSTLQQVESEESGWRCTLTARAFEAVDSDFDAPDTDFVRHVTPLADVTNLDDELKQRVLLILGAGSADPKLWDSAVRTAGVILEERLREVGGIADAGRVGQDLVNGVFGKSGTLASRFSLDAERQGYRDLYAGVVGAFRNPYAHRLMDPVPEDGGAFIVFINLLLKMLEDLRHL